MTHVKKMMLFLFCIILQGCITTEVSESDMAKYKGKHVSDFLSDQRFYNIHDKKYNIFTGRGASRKYFLYSPALYVEEQVKAPSINVQRLCKENGGEWTMIKYNGSTVFESEMKANKEVNNMALYAVFNEFKYFNDSYINYQKQGTTYRYQSETLHSYIKKNYFYNEFICNVEGQEQWSLSIIPVAIDKDSSDIDQLWILMIVND
ncbi:hypothetical protein [Providencia sp. PROV219]|uniref:hypothetical protein n=1 Tax=Providencia sp. PROV219 TaxID=2949914 RepID=UPI00234BD5B4|nr:hypothetical protein [Providencia sp. PROV219]